MTYDHMLESTPEGICENCGKPEIVQLECSSESRISDYFQTLSEAGLWPAKDLYLIHSPTEVLELVEKASDEVCHDCDGDKNCPLVEEMGLLYDRVSQACAATCAGDLKRVDEFTYF